MEHMPTTLSDTVTLPKREFIRLKREADAYRNLAAKVFELPLRDPIAQVVSDFKDTGLYADGFLEDLETGLRQSSYATRYGNTASAKRP